MPISEEDILNLAGSPAPEPEKPAPTMMEKWMGRGSFIGRLGETMDRPAGLARSVVGGNMKEAVNSAKGLPGFLPGMVDLATERVGAPSLQEKTDSVAGFDPSKVPTGQDLLKRAGVTERADNPLLSLPGVAGFALESALDPLHIPKVKNLAMAPAKAALQLGGKAMDLPLLKDFKRGPIEAAAGKADRARQVVEKEGLLEEGLRRKQLDATAAGKSEPLVERELGTIEDQFGKHGSARERNLKKTEWAMGQNVGTGKLQITPENEQFLKQFHHDADRTGAIMGAINDARTQSGKDPLNFTSFNPQDVNKMKQIVDASELPVEKLNSIFEAVGGARPFTEDPVTQARMRMFQHANAVGLNSFGEEILNSKTAYKRPVAPDNLFPVGDKPGIKTFSEHLGGQRYVVDGLTHNGAPLIFPNADDAVRAQKAYERIAPNKLGNITTAEKVLNVIDDINKTYKYSVTQPFTKYHVVNKITNRMVANLAGDVPVVGKHYSIANDVMGGGGYDKVFDIGGQPLTGQQLVSEFQAAGGSALPNINPALGKVPELDRYSTGPLDKVYQAAQTVGKPFERIGASVAGAGIVQKNPSTLGKVTGSMVEESDRFGVYLYNRMKGMDAKSAVEAADGVLGNQSKAVLTPMERYPAGAMLFYNYTRNTIPTMLKAFTEKPEVFNAVLRANRQPKEEQPSYLGEKVTIDDPRSKGSVISNIPNPIENITNQFGADNPLSMLSPIPKVALQAMTNRDFLTGKELSGKAPNYLPKSLTNESPTGQTETNLVPGVSAQMENLALQNLPISRALSDLNYAMKPGTQASDVIANQLSGVKVQRFGDKSAPMYNKVDEARDTLDSYLGTGAVFKTPYGYQLKPEVLTKMPRHEAEAIQKAYRLYGALLPKAGAVRKAEQAKLK